MFNISRLSSPQFFNIWQMARICETELGYQYAEFLRWLSQGTKLESTWHIGGNQKLFGMLTNHYLIHSLLWNWANFPLIASVCVELNQEASNVLSPKSSVAPGCNAVNSYYSFVAPAPQGIGMDMEEMSYFPYRQHVAYLIIIYHIFPRLLFN